MALNVYEGTQRDFNLCYIKYKQSAFIDADLSTSSASAVSISTFKDYTSSMEPMFSDHIKPKDII